MIRLLLFAICFAVSAAHTFASNSVVNLSHYDLMQPDFATMHDEGIVAAIHEATYPPSRRDEKYLVRQEAAVRAGLLWGAYHYANASDPIRQADHFLGVVERCWRSAETSGQPGEVLLVLDFEKNNHYPGGTMRVDQAVAFVQRVHARTGKFPGLYSGENRLRALMASPKTSANDRAVLAHCWLWIANYHYEPRNVGPWRDWTMWQYTGDGVCDLPRTAYPKNIANIKNAERNIFRGSSAEVRDFWATHGWSPGSAAP